MKEVKLTADLAGRIRQIYDEMEKGYEQVATLLQFSCHGCPDNCCDSYFQHHTFVEWGYLWLGFRQLPERQQEDILERSRLYIAACEQSMARNDRPQVMCPLNENGLCILYAHRLMVCRTHGVPATMQRPDGQRLNFPGCFRCQELVKETFAHESEAPRTERTKLLRSLAMMENELMDGKRHLYPRIQLTIAQMLVNGPPSIAVPHCERKNSAE
ncbi:MAG: hypothetical protein KJ990_03095 [Proteobacteria bacterium]|nr:hypothetical protein [Pseudomonadota bacterium]MBU1648178.1 hypothetical protein [Pseudomonadota bacterium]MBU1985685.1 hypothetical protein [Pseudomonadota bacterium]